MSHSTEQLQLDRPIFVGGSGSSGSSLLARLLDRHSQIYCGPEASLFNKRVLFEDFARVRAQLPQWLAKGIPTDGYFVYAKILPHADQDRLSAELLIRWANDSNTLREFVDRIQSHCLQESGKRIYAEKTPSNVYCFAQLAELYPQCTLIHPVRDGRDVVCSLMRRGYNVFQATSMWLYNTAAALACRNLPQYYEYSYEKLAREPEKTLAEICNRLGVSFEGAMLDSESGESQSGRLDEVWKNSPRASISTRSIGRYREEMDERTWGMFSCVRLSNRAAKKLGVEPWSALELLRKLGYEADSPVRSRQAMAGYLMAAQDYWRTNLQRLRRWGQWRQPLTCFSRS